MNTFAVGIIILALAIIINIIGSILGFETWYSFLSDPRIPNILDSLWLFILYPFLLGLSAKKAIKLVEKNNSGHGREKAETKKQ